MSAETILTNARIVTPTASFTGTVVARDREIVAVEDGRSHAPGARDLAGDWLLPGLIEMHTDNVEKHFMPRPGVMWPSAKAAVLAHDAQIIAAGITTVFDALAIGEYEERQMRRQILQASLEAVRDAKRHGELRADHYYHMRCEVSDPAVVEIFTGYVDDPLTRLASVMDHTPGQRQWSRLDKYIEYNKGESWTAQELERRLADLKDRQAKHADAHRRAVARMCRERRIVLASHDDATAGHIDEAIADGVTIAEFPITLEAARAAQANALRTVMGAPNVVRGGSHSGNISALDAARAGLLDGLSSDYVPASLIHAAFLLHDRAGIPLPEAVAKVSGNVAAMVGMDDRGAIAPGLRADFVRVRAASAPIVREVFVGGERVF